MGFRPYSRPASLSPARYARVQNALRNCMKAPNAVNAECDQAGYPPQVPGVHHARF